MFSRATSLRYMYVYTIINIYKLFIYWHNINRYIENIEHISIHIKEVRN